MLSSFCDISDYMDHLKNINDENKNNNNEKQIEYLKQNLLKNIYSDSNSDYNNSMESKNKSDDKSNKSVDKSYFEKNEQINEVKINIYYSLALDLRLIRDNNTKYYIFLTDKNIVKTKRLIIQHFFIENKRIIYKDKEYIFIPIINKGKDFTFNYNNQKITFKKGKNSNENKMEINNEKLLDINKFIDSFNNPEIKGLIQQGELVEDNEKQKFDKNAKKSSEEETKSQNTKSSNLSFMTTTDNSEKETEGGDRFYKINKENDYTRFFFTSYEKEIDGIYNHHKNINLNIKNEVGLKEGIEKLKTGYDDENDLKCGIIYKNFEGDLIGEREPVILEVKKGFRIIDLFNQIKQNSKIFNRFSCDEEINMPKFAIGIICSDYKDDYKEQIDLLYDAYKFDKGITYLDHIVGVIKKNQFKVVIGVYKGSKILNYPLDIEDWKIEGKLLSKRVDLSYMNKATGINKNEEELSNIEKQLKNKFKSLTFIETVPIGDYKKSNQQLTQSNQQLTDKLTQSNQQLVESSKKLKEIENLLYEFDSDSNNNSSDETIRKIKILLNMKKNNK